MTRSTCRTVPGARPAPPSPQVLGETVKLRFDATTTSGSAVAPLFHVWCSVRDAGPGCRPEAAELAGAVGEMSADLGLDPPPPA